MAAIAINVHKNSYHDAVAITPNDSANLTDPVSALFIGGTGAVKVVTISGSTVTLTGVPVGVLPLAVTKVFATGTTATNIAGLK